MTKKNWLIWLMVVLVCLPFLRTIWLKGNFYLNPVDLDYAQNLYGMSQYVQKEGASWIADEILYTYSSWYYINGGSPILVNSEHPPLVKYLIGLNIKLFANEKIIVVIFAVLSLVALFWLSKIFIKPIWLSLVPVALFSWERLFQEQLKFLPQFEVFYLTFLLFAFIFFIKGLDKMKYFWVSSLFLGLLWASRPWMVTLPLLAAWAIYLIVGKQGRFFLVWMATVPLAGLILLLSYFKLFLEGWSIIKVLSVQKWIFWYHQGHIAKLGSVWPYLFLNRWYVWWGDEVFQPVAQWNIFWPIFTFISVAFSIFILLKFFVSAIRGNFSDSERCLGGVLRFDQKITVLCLWVVFYLGFLSLGTVTSRYLFYLLPFCYILGTYFLKRIWACLETSLLSKFFYF